MLKHPGYPPALPGIPQSINPLDDVFSGSPRTPEAYEFIRSCLQDCEANHPECNITDQELPTRLLDVQHEDAPEVMLVETGSELAEHTPTYIALSYCWGKGQSVMLKSENLEAMKQGLPVSSLPQTLQDAVTVTRALGQRYLWIDALCIIQDSPIDWEVEASRMASVYRGAYLTIAPATASDVSEGFLSRNYREMNTWYKEPYREEWINHNRQSTILGTRFVKGAWSCDDTQSVLAPPLAWSSRGWTLQEQLLSRRLLKYHAYELRWVCQVKNTCQCSSNSEGGGNSSNNPLDNPGRFFISAEGAYELWYRLIVDYTARKLTDYRDKLPAISGLAKIFQQTIQSPYIAGMWVDYLLWDMLWAVPERAETLYAPEHYQYIAPSFSWASVTSPVHFATDMLNHGDGVDWDLDPMVVIEDHGSVTGGHDPLGRMSNGWVKVRGYISKVTLSFDPPDDDDPDGFAWLTAKNGDGTHYSFYEDAWLEDFETTDEQGNVEISARRIRRHAPDNTPTNELASHRIKQDAVVYLLLMASSLREVNPTTTMCDSYLLVLGICHDKPGMYERLGVTINVSELEDNYVSTFISTADEYKTVTIV